jgi:hypothetical protein
VDPEFSLEAAEEVLPPVQEPLLVAPEEQPPLLLLPPPLLHQEVDLDFSWVVVALVQERLPQSVVHLMVVFMVATILTIKSITVTSVD